MVITKQYVVDNYDIDKERLVIDTITYVGDLDFAFTGIISKEAFVARVIEGIEVVAQGPNKDAFFQYKFGEWDNPDTIEVVQKISRAETDEEVINRLQKTLRDDQRSKKSLEQAKRLLEDNNYVVERSK